MQIYRARLSVFRVWIDYTFRLSLQCLKEGDIIIGKVTYKRPFGIIVTLTMLESGCNRDFSDLDIQVYY